MKRWVIAVLLLIAPVSAAFAQTKPSMQDGGYWGGGGCNAFTFNGPNGLYTMMVDSHGNLCVNVSGGSPYPSGSTPITASTTGTTAATTATLAASSTLYTYICGLSIRANATAAATADSTVTGVVSGTLHFTQWTAPLASGIGLTEMIFVPCLKSSAVNTAIAVISAAPGSGGVVSVTAWGFQQ